MTNYVQRARVITEIVRRRGQPTVIWGGIHPTIRPKECLETADYVVLGEGEDAFCDLLTMLETDEDTSEILNIGYHHADDVRINPVRPLVQDLDRFPFPITDPIITLCGTGKRAVLFR